MWRRRGGPRWGPEGGAGRGANLARLRWAGCGADFVVAIFEVGDASGEAEVLADAVGRGFREARELGGVAQER